MIDVIHVDEETTIHTTRALLKNLSLDDPLARQWIEACRRFGVNVRVDNGVVVFSKPV